MDIKKLLTQANEYYIEKLIKGEYELKNIDEHMVSVLIDNEYKFQLWIANDESSFHTYSNTSVQNKIDLIFTGEQKKTLHKKFTTQYKKEQRKKLEERIKKATEDLAKLD